MPGLGNSHYKDVSPLRHNPKYSLNRSSSDKSHPSLSSLQSGKTLLVPPPQIWFVWLQHSITQSKNHLIVFSCPSVRDSHKYLFKEWKIQIRQSQMVPQTNYQLIEEGSGFPFAVATPLWSSGAEAFSEFRDPCDLHPSPAICMWPC